MLIATQPNLCSCSSYGVDRARMVHSAFRADSSHGLADRLGIADVALVEPASARHQPIDDRSVDLDPRADAATDSPPFEL
jgi:hypothetical protein